MTKAYFLNSNLTSKRTGIEEAAMKRTFYFKEVLGIDPIFITAKHYEQSQEVFNDLKNKNRIHASTKLINIYSYYQYDLDLPTYQPEEYHRAERKLTAIGVPQTNDVRYINEEKQTVIYSKKNELGRTIFNNHFKYLPEKTLYRRDYYDTTTGHLTKMQRLINGKTIFEVFYTLSGKPCIYKTYELNKEDTELKSIELLDEKGNVKALFLNESEFITHWFEEYFSQLPIEKTKYLIVDRSALYSKAIEKFRRPDLKVIFLMHSSHVAAGECPIKGKINTNYRHLLENPFIADSIILFTKKQKEHIQERFGNWKHLKVIPHSLESQPIKVDFETRDSDKIIYLARFSKIKNQRALLEAFELVLRDKPSATLHLYGEGVTKTEDLKWVEEKNLGENIFIYPFTQNVQEVYNQAGLAVCTSKLEGFSLFILESLSHGLPIVSFDIDYGPSDMIKDGENGFLVEKFDIQTLARKILSILCDKDYQEKMSEMSYNYAQEYNLKKISIIWKELLQELN